MQNKYLLKIAILAFIITSCSTKRYAEIENPTEFKNGEWISNTDSLSGISIRKGKLAFFKNMKFTADSIYDYKVVDSIIPIGPGKNRFKTFIKRMSMVDTLYSEIIEFSDSTIILKKNNFAEVYKLK